MRISDWSSDVCSSDLILCFDCKLHGQFLENFLAEPVHDHRNGVFRGQAALHGIKQLVFTDTRSRGFVLDAGRRVLHLHGREGVCRSEEHTSELQSLMRISYAVFCLNKKKNKNIIYIPTRHI